MKLVANNPSAKRKLKRLPKKNGVTRKTASLACFKYQKSALKQKAASRGMTVSYYLNYILWSEWL